MSEFKILLVGGGSGGHLTPLVSVAEAIKQQNDSIKVIHIGQKGEALDDVTRNSVIDEHFAISAGKFRRYHGESFLSHLFDFKTIFLNAIDFFKFLLGTVQSMYILAKIKPDSILLKGGFVCVPVGLAARFHRIPYITHDSDAVPGLANKLTASKAIYNTTAMPSNIYPYDQSKTIQVGIPLRSEFSLVDKVKREEAKNALGIDKETFVILSVGGGLGAQKLNKALVKASKKLLTDNKVFLIHLTGKKLFNETQIAYEIQLNNEEIGRLKLIDFTSELVKYSTAADLIITRAGATNIAEFAAQAKPCIIVPAPHLTGGQQLHNAKVLEDNNAAIVLQEDKLSELYDTIQKIIDAPETERIKFGDKLHELCIDDAGNRLATLLTEIANKEVKS